MELEHIQNSDYSSANRNPRRDSAIWQINVWGAEGRCARALLVPGTGPVRVRRRRLRRLKRACHPRISQRCPREVYIKRSIPEAASDSAGCRRRSVADRGQVVRSRCVHGLEVARRPEIGDLSGRVAQRVEQLELRTVVVGDRGEVLVKRHFHQLQRVNHFLRPMGGKDTHCA
jgi:hypothetical protein